MVAGNPHLDELNPLVARDLLDNSGAVGARQDLPQIEFNINSNDTFRAMANVAAQSWKSSLNAIVHLNIDEWTVYLDKLKGTTPPDMFRMGYCAVYPDASNFLYDAFHSGSDQNFSHWSSPAYDRLVEQAARGSMLVAQELLDTRSTLQRGRSIQRTLTRVAEQYPHVRTRHRRQAD